MILQWKLIKMKKVYKFIIAIILIIIILIALSKIKVVKAVVYVVLLSFIMAYILKPIHLILINRGINKKVSAMLLVGAMMLIILSLIIFLIPSILKETLTIDVTRTEIKDYIQKIQSFVKPLSKSSTGENLIMSVYDKFNYELKIIINKAVNSILIIFENALDATILPIISYYFLADLDEIRRSIVKSIPHKYRNLVKKIAYDIDVILSKYTICQLALCILIGALTFVILSILKVNYPILLSIINGLFNIIPYFGPIFGAVPAIIVALLISPKKAIYTAIALYLIQIIEGNIISPKMTGDSVDMHPLVVIILLIVGEKLAGFIGMVLIIPAAVIIRVVYEDLNYYLF